jgi:hypothetical protein
MHSTATIRARHCGFFIGASKFLIIIQFIIEIRFVIPFLFKVPALRHG